MVLTCVCLGGTLGPHQVTPTCRAQSQQALGSAMLRQLSQASSRDSFLSGRTCPITMVVPPASAAWGTHMHLYDHAHTYTYTNTHTKTHTHIHTYTHTYTHTNMDTHKYMYTQTHIYMHTHTQNHTHILKHSFLALFNSVMLFF